MFGTLKMLMDVHGPNSKGIVWAHNSHVSLKRAFWVPVPKQEKNGRKNDMN